MAAGADLRGSGSPALSPPVVFSAQNLFVRPPIGARERVGETDVALSGVNRCAGLALDRAADLALATVRPTQGQVPGHTERGSRRRAPRQILLGSVCPRIPENARSNEFEGPRSIGKATVS